MARSKVKLMQKKLKSLFRLLILNAIAFRMRYQHTHELHYTKLLFARNASFLVEMCIVGCFRIRWKQTCVKPNLQNMFIKIILVVDSHVKRFYEHFSEFK